jgi:hypothetical protein
MSTSPSRRPANAIFVPSGDQVGEASTAERHVVTMAGRDEQVSVHARCRSRRRRRCGARRQRDDKDDRAKRESRGKMTPNDSCVRRAEMWTHRGPSIASGRCRRDPSPEGSVSVSRRRQRERRCASACEGAQRASRSCATKRGEGFGHRLIKRSVAFVCLLRCIPLERRCAAHRYGCSLRGRIAAGSASCLCSDAAL